MTDPVIVKAFRDYYAPLFNAGMWFNLHCYMARDGSGQNGPGVPLAERFTRTYPTTMHGKTFTMRQSWWTAEWWRWFPLFCGFDPRRSYFITDEMGLEGTVEMVDAPNSGGFHANPQVNMVKYLTDWRTYCALPVLFGDDMKEYPSNMRLGQVFCGNGGTKWAGYTVDPTTMPRGLPEVQMETYLARWKSHDVAGDVSAPELLALAKLWR